MKLMSLIHGSHIYILKFSLSFFFLYSFVPPCLVGNALSLGTLDPRKNGINFAFSNHLLSNTLSTEGQMQNEMAKNLLPLNCGKIEQKRGKKLTSGKGDRRGRFCQNFYNWIQNTLMTKLLPTFLEGKIFALFFAFALWIQTNPKFIYDRSKTLLL